MDNESSRANMRVKILTMVVGELIAELQDRGGLPSGWLASKERDIMGTSAADEETAGEMLTKLSEGLSY